MIRRYILLPILLCIITGAQAKKWTAGEVVAVVNKVNNYWQANNKPDIKMRWNNAVYHTGNMEAYFLTKNEKYKDYSTAWAEFNHWTGKTEADPAKWKFKPYGETEQHVLFGDMQLCFETYIDLFLANSPDKRDTRFLYMIRRPMEVMRYEAYSTPTDYWWWADALYMGMPVLGQMYMLTHDTKYLDKAYDNILYTDSVMLDPETGLYYRDAKYIYPKHKTDGGKKDFWARGDGWVLAGLAKTIGFMPKDYAHRQFFVDKFTKMARKVAPLQQKEGYWTRSMLAPEQAPGRETSGTALFTFAMAWGVNHGILSKKEYDPVIQKAWGYLTETALQPDGKVGYVQPIGEKAISTQTLDANSQADFGVGVYLLAACEYARYVGDKPARKHNKMKAGDGWFVSGGAGVSF